MSSTPFFEVFSDLKLNRELHGIFEDVGIDRVGRVRDRNILRIYITSGRLITKDKVYAVEDEIYRQYFPDKDLTVRLMEKFHLSRQYTPKNLYHAYWDSILEEFSHYGTVEYQILRTAKVTFPADDVIDIALRDSFLSRERESSIYGILEKIFCGRCGLKVNLTISYYEYHPQKMRGRDSIPAGGFAYPGAESTSSRIGGNQQKPEEIPAGGLPWAAPPVEKAETSENAAAEKDGGGRPGTAAEEKAGGSRGPREDAKSAASGRSGKSGRRGTGSSRSFRHSDNPDVIWGRDFDDEPIPVEQIIGEMGEVCIRGQILTFEARPIRSGKKILLFAVSDFTDTIMVKMFCREEDADEIIPKLTVGSFVKVKGVTAVDRYDSDLTISSVRGIRKIPDFREVRSDNSPVKRVELHCHTKMSDMDGVSDVQDIIARADAWGHRAIAITDHGAVQAFPEANHAKVTNPDFKVIYGMEAYLVDDEKGLVVRPRGQKLTGAYVVFDLETTGFSPYKNKIIEIGAVKVKNRQITDRFSTFVNPEVPIPYEIEQLTGIDDSMVLDAPPIGEVLLEFLEFCRDAVMVAHNADFDMSFISRNCAQQGLPCDFTVLDTVALSRALLPNLSRYKLDTVAKALGVSLEHHHRAVDDAACTAEIFLKLAKKLESRGIEDLDALSAWRESNAEMVKKMPTYHAILLAANDIGRVNLYRLVSLSHLTYYNKRPRVPKSELAKYREGLLVGSACEAGELYRALENGRPKEEVVRLVEFYDYLEIQPIANNRFLLREGEGRGAVQTEEDLRDINREIVRLGDEFGKPVVATCDVHFLDPQDEVYRRIIMAGQGFKDADEQPPLYLRTTEEMLKEFDYLGSSKAEEVVITNTNRIADMCEKISPVRPDKCPPVIENSDQTLREICYKKAHEIYGEKLPQIVTERLEKELSSIISNGFAVMYIIAQKLVWKSNEDGYLVGSRGSVGSSFVATMAGITEVNPLPPHYICPNCYYTDFDSDLVKSYAGKAGCDMPDRTCPVCGQPLRKEGFDIPFETFLGFRGNKEPDIDLNFSGEYQSRAHKYTEVIFGKGQTYRAGTIGTLADKTAFGYVKNYYEERGVHKRNCEIDRIVQGCVGVRRTTGQHPGGIIVLPHGEEINTFTPVQHPANDTKTDIVTTHFDYHSIDHNLLKLDILGHDDPTMIRMLQDLTGVDPKEIPLDSPEVMSLFQNTDALGIRPEDIGGCRLGALGIPEFGTDFAMQMLLDTKPTAFSDLVRIAGLAHGTDVWLGNAQTLIKEGKATISTAICTRDDIMIYLIGMGIDKELSFTIMESVRKGRGLKPEWEEEMKAHGVPDWYIWSCRKIKYMFPKAHAAAYVMMAWRIAWHKIHHPLAYYAAFYSIRATALDYEMMCQGPEKLNHFLQEYGSRKDELSQKEQDTYRDMRIVQEMYARGFEFVPLDIYRAKAHRFQIIDGKLMPALDTLEGLGDKAADAVEEAVKDGPFLSKDDFRQRTKVNKTVVDLMDSLHLFGDLPESNQMSLFDLQ